MAVNCTLPSDKVTYFQSKLTTCSLFLKMVCFYGANNALSSTNNYTLNNNYICFSPYIDINIKNKSTCQTLRHETGICLLDRCQLPLLESERHKTYLNDGSVVGPDRLWGL